MTQVTHKDEALHSNGRIPVGVWTEFPPGTKWANEGMSRLLGFLIEGVALGKKYTFRVVLGDGVREAAEEDFAQLAATKGLDYTVHSPNDPSMRPDDYAALARFANAKVPVQGWISMFPYFRHALSLNAPVATIFPDGIPAVFPTPDPAAWGTGGYLLNWRDNIRTIMEGCDGVITFSRHVAKDEVQKLFGIPASKISVVHHAPPDLKDLTPYVSQRRRSPASLAAAGDILREHARERGWTYLMDYPFEEVPFIAVSTQDRVTKNIRMVAETVRNLVRTERFDMRLFMTTPLHFGRKWTPLPDYVEHEMLMPDVVSMPELPRPVHAAFYHCAAVAIHPAIFEGGHGTFPYFEAASVGTPCLMARGPHVQELVDDEPSLDPFVFDPSDRQMLADKIKYVLANREDVLDVQARVYDRLGQRSWADVAAGYAEAALNRAPSVS
ncbi:hypothetical protein D3C72_608890 [compost metagenome]